MPIPVKSLRPASLALPVVLAMLALGGCKRDAGNSDAKASAAASEPASDLSISDARLVLPAVKGNPGAAYFSVENASTGTKAIAGIAIDGVGKAETHQTIANEMTSVDRVEIAPGTHIAFEPGKLHVMAFDLAGTLKAGGTTRLTVTFATGETATAAMAIQTAGDAAMGGKDHGSSH
jgi:copper(I)-binding protein